MAGRATLGVGDEADAAGVQLAGRGGQHGAVLLPGRGRRRGAGQMGEGNGAVVWSTADVPIPGRACPGGCIRDVTEAKRAPLPEPPTRVRTG